MSDIKVDILEMGLRLWRADVEPSARRIAIELKLSSHAAVLYHFKSSLGLRNAIAYHAVEQGESRVIVRLISENHTAVASMSDDMRQEHMRACRA